MPVFCFDDGTYDALEEQQDPPWVSCPRGGHKGNTPLVKLVTLLHGISVEKLLQTGISVLFLFSRLQ